MINSKNSRSRRSGRRARLLATSALVAVGLGLAPSGVGGASATPAPQDRVTTARSERMPIELPTQPGDPEGVNYWSCRPDGVRPFPVVIVHGTGGDRRYDTISTALVAAGYCTFSLDYGNRGFEDIEASAGQLADYVDRVLGATGARRVSMVGHSQGGMMPRWYIRFLGGAGRVEDLVGLSSSNHGSDLFAGPAAGASLVDPLCAACTQQASGSKFLARLNEGDETPGRVDYTQIQTAYDEIVVPYTSAFLAEGPRTTNVTLQDLCPTNIAEHATIVADALTVRLVLLALESPGPLDPARAPAC